MKKSLLSLFGITLIMANVFSQSPGSWTFISHPDWHTGDGELRGARDITNQVKILSDMATFKPEFLLLTGDMVGGMWLSDAFQQKYAPDGSLEDLVMTCGDICYGGINKRFREFGLKPIGCLGDHELGDQNWDLNSRKSSAVKYFKEAFSRAYTLDSAGKSLYDGYIGSVPQRPIGTPYENTSYAFINKNVMVVSVDIFTFESPTVLLDSVRGTVSLDITGAHRQWLDDVLAAGNKIDSVDFIIVQSHFPVMIPMRKHQTSHMTVLHEEQSAFWKLLTKNKVDLYYAGEVHALTPTMDNNSGVIQIIHGSFISSPTHSFLVNEVEKNKLTLYCREKKDENEYIYETTGKLVIDKTSGQKKVTYSGSLSPIDREGLLIHYAFEDNGPVTRISNTGVFGPKLYYGNNTGLRTTDGVIGQGIEFPFGAGGYSKSFGVNPFHEDMARTLVCWVKTNSPDKMVLITTGNGSYTFGLNMGVPQLIANGNTVAAECKKAIVNDNLWHHLAVTYSGRGHSLSEVLFYIDGNVCKSMTSNSTTMINTSPEGFIILGSKSDLKSDFFNGSMDEVGLWSSALTESMVKTIYGSVRMKDFRFNVSQMDSLFHLFREKGGDTKAGGLKWRYSSGLKGKPGEIRKHRDHYSIPFNESGEGVISVK